MKRFINTIINSDEASRKFWFLLLTPITMIGVVAAWIFYMNLSIGSLNQETASKKIETKNETSFLDVLKNGWNVITNQVKGKITETKSITIQGANVNFVMEGLRDIKSNRLPE